MSANVFSSESRLLKLFAVVAPVLLIGGYLLEVSNTLVNKWLKFDESFGHGFLILAVTLYYIYRKLDDTKLFAIQKLDVLTSIVLFIVTAVGYQIGLHYSIEVFTQLALIGFWVSILALIVGFSGLVTLWFPLAFLIFAIPVWDALNPALVFVTTEVVTYILSFMDIVIFVDGSTIETPFGTMVIADSCSGLRYLIVGMAISALALYEENMSLKDKCFCFGFAVFISILSNWFRVFLLVLIGYKSQMQSDLVEDHELFGLIVFFVFFSLFFWLLNKKQINAE